jgi:hypothetical protein
MEGLRKPRAIRAVEFDDAPDRFGGAVASAAAGEVGQELLLPRIQGAAQAGDLEMGQVGNDFSTLMRRDPRRGRVSNAGLSRW